MCGQLTTEVRKRLVHLIRYRSHAAVPLGFVCQPSQHSTPSATSPARLRDRCLLQRDSSASDQDKAIYSSSMYASRLIRYILTLPKRPD